MAHTDCRIVCRMQHSEGKPEGKIPTLFPLFFAKERETLAPLVLCLVVCVADHRLQVSLIINDDTDHSTNSFSSRQEGDQSEDNTRE